MDNRIEVLDNVALEREASRWGSPAGGRLPATDVSKCRDGGHCGGAEVQDGVWLGLRRARYWPSRAASSPIVVISRQTD